jgi:AAA domain
MTGPILPLSREKLDAYHAELERDRQNREFITPKKQSDTAVKISEMYKTETPKQVFHGTFTRKRSMEHPGKTEYIPAYRKGLKVRDGEELMTLKLPPRNLLLSPWLPEKGLTMIYAPRGVGKTWVALGIAHAIASGGWFLKWKAPAPKRVLYIDGEMSMQMLRDRYAAVVVASGEEAPKENFRLVAADDQQDGLPDLSDPEEQKYYDAVIADADVVVLDNYSTLARIAKENEADSFGPVQGWLLAQRAAGRSVLAIHHAGKGGEQRGTSKKEDALDTVISLSRPPGYSAAEGARFEVRFTKNRGFYGEEAAPFEARFSDGQWSTSDIASGDSDEELKALRDEGLSFRQISERTSIPIATLHRRFKGDGK